MQSPTTSNYRTIKQARAELRDWGNFWRRYYEKGGGSVMFAFIQAQRSQTKYHRRQKNTEQLRENPCRGVEIPVAARCTETRTPVSDSEKEVFVPWRLQSIDDFISSLDSRLSEPLKKVYIQGHSREEVKGFWLDRAENAVMLMK